MAQTKLADTLAYYGLSSRTLSGQSILDIFVLQNVVDPADALKLKKNLKSNREVENFLLQNGIVTKDTINKAYSIILKIPFVSLKNLEINKQALSIIPEKAARKFGIIPFAVDGNILRIAIARPADLLLGFENGLDRIFNNAGYEIELFITGDQDYNNALSQYNAKYVPNLLLTRASYPIIYLRNQPIPEKFLKKLPRDFIEKYRVVVFDENKTGNFLIAAEKPDAPETLKLVSLLQKENNVNFELFATSKEDIDYVLDLYDGKAAIFTENENLNTESLEQESKTEEPKKTLNFSNFWTAAPEEKDDNLTIDSVEYDPSQDVSSSVGSNPSADEQKLSFLKEMPVADVAVRTQPQAKVEEAKPVGNLPKVQKINIQSDDDLDSSETSSIEPKDDEKVDDALSDKDIGRLIPNEIIEATQLQSVVDEGYIPKIVAAIINYALNNRVSDIHVEPETKLLRVRCRIDGILRDIAKMPLSFHPPFISRVKILSKLKIDESRIPQDGRFDVTFEKHNVDVRVSTLPTVHGEKIVMRILDKSQGILSLEDLGMQGSAFNSTIEAISTPHGIILSTGPTGSGKSTTLYAIINRISVPGINIVTLEDPVEYEIPGVNQCQVKPDIGFTFASGLRSVLRQDPNVIMVGEVRDSETANMATHAALTGHLVLSTLHTNDASGALPRLTNMGVEPFLITSSVNLIIAQRLVRRICPKCKEELKVPEKLMQEITLELHAISPANHSDKERLPKEMKLYYGKGCSECNQGYRGRVGLFEVLKLTPEIEDLAVDRKTANEIKAAAIKNGMITMKQDGIIKAFQGLTTIDEVFQAVAS